MRGKSNPMIAKGTRVHHHRHGAGTVLVHYDRQDAGLGKVARIRDLARERVGA